MKETPSMAQEPKTLPPLEPGDRLDQPTFHARYQAMPEHVRAELIGGVVFMHSPAKKRHSRSSSHLVFWLVAYENATPGTETHDNGSNLLGPEKEPQPDACLLIAPECGGQTSEKDDWIVGPPELIGEVGSSTESIDLHAKKEDYESAGVKEYLVVALRQKRVYWFVNHDHKFVDLPPDADGILRSRTFPGLWLDPVALIEGNMGRVWQVLQDGLLSPEHAAFVQRLASVRRG